MHHFTCVSLTSPLLSLSLSLSLIVHIRGGNSAIDKVTGQTVLIDDQTVHSASCNALLSSWKLKQAIVLIAGNGYNLFPYDLGNRSYVVLGYYWITHAWGMSQVVGCSTH